MDEEMVMSVVESQVTSTAVAGLKSDFRLQQTQLDDNF
jgi:hypothetical protein